MATEPMELLLRKYFWAVQLTCIALAALLAAKIVNLFIEAALSPAPAPPAASLTPRPAAAAEAPAALDPERLARLTGLTLPVEPVGDDAKPDLNSDPVRTSMRVRLLGTLLGGPEWSLAS
ncbi:MAG TPA: type II secretion system protein GspC, partial [Myxococcaceae bacterium]|nr:type II secretion system protein GspC [Myxococcaceae bacterium]